MRFEGRVFKVGRWWAIEVPLLGVYTQARIKSAAYEKVKEAIEEFANIDGFNVNLVY